MKTVHKFPLAFDGNFSAALAMPVGARTVLFDVQFSGAMGEGPRMGIPTLWALVDTEAELEPRQFRVFGTGHAVPPGAQHVGSYQAEPFVWHVFEIVDDVPADLPAEAYPHWRVLQRDGFTLRADRAWLAPDDVPAGHLSTEQLIAVATLQEHGYGAVVNV